MFLPALSTCSEGGGRIATCADGRSFKNIRLICTIIIVHNVSSVVLALLMGKGKKLGILGTAARSVQKPARISKEVHDDTQSKVERLAPRNADQLFKRHERRTTVKNEKPAGETSLRLQSLLHKQSSTIVARLLRAEDTGKSGATIKGLCLAPQIQNKAAVYAVVCETLRHAPILRRILGASGFLANNPEMPEAAALVLLYDHLIGQGVKPRGKAERTFLAARSSFDVHVQSLLRAGNANSLTELLPSASLRSSQPVRPRSVRVNLLKLSVDTALRQLGAPPQSWPPKHRKPLQPVRDACLPDVLLLPPGLDLHDHPLVQGGALILQGRASCMPAHALQPQPGWHVADCCAAPGNKTTHVAALVGAAGRVHAFEKDARRCNVLRATLERAGATHVDVHEGDFLAVDVLDVRFVAVRGVILDPSCSGSGTAVTRQEFLTAPAAAASGETAESCGNGGSVRGDGGGFPGCTSDSSERVAALAAFQAAALRHALRFPALQRLVYSTCSVFREENEDVVAAVLPDALAQGFTLAHALPQWPRRGLEGTYAWSERVVRVHPELDETDGFFVAVFERAGAGHA